MTTTHPSPTLPPSTTTVLDPGHDAARVLASFAELSSMDVATAIRQAARRDADLLADDQAVEGADPIMVAELNAVLFYLAQHGPAVAFASRMLRRIVRKIEGTVVDTFGPDLDEAVYDGLRVVQRMRAAYALLDQVADAHPDVI
jgi:hypothetical protein